MATRWSPPGTPPDITGYTDVVACARRCFQDANAPAAPSAPAKGNFLVRAMRMNLRLRTPRCSLPCRHATPWEPDDVPMIYCSARHCSAPCTYMHVVACCILSARARAEVVSPSSLIFPGKIFEKDKFLICRSQSWGKIRRRYHFFRNPSPRRSESVGGIFPPQTRDPPDASSVAGS